VTLQSKSESPAKKKLPPSGAAGLNTSSAALTAASGLPKMPPMVGGAIAAAFGLPTPPPPVPPFQTLRQPGPLPQPPPPASAAPLAPSPLSSLMGSSSMMPNDVLNSSAASALYGSTLGSLTQAPPPLGSAHALGQTLSLPAAPPAPTNGPSGQSKRNFGNLLGSGKPASTPAMLSAAGQAPTPVNKGGFGSGASATGAMFGGDLAAGPLGSPSTQLSASLTSPAHAPKLSAHGDSSKGEFLKSNASVNV
jgi:hypothetical protein